MDPESARLRVLVSGSAGDRLHQVTRTVAGSGHDVIVRPSPLPDVARITAAERPDVALVIVDDVSEQALKLIDQTVHQAASPVIAVIGAQDEVFINEAAKLGVFAEITGDDPGEMQEALDVVLQRFVEYHALERPFARRAVTERAKGILMDRHGIDERAALQMLRDEARRNHCELADMADAVMAGHPMLPARQP